MDKRRAFTLSLSIVIVIGALWVILTGISRQGALSRLVSAVEGLGGAREKNGIFITDSGLIENITDGDDGILNANLAGIESFADKSRVPAVVALIPTAAAIMQEQLPANAELLNQKQLITQCYEQLSGKAGTVDVYSRLFSARDERLYYRTASNLTGQGGYRVYTALASRLGLSEKEISDFEIENLPVDYYGDLYDRAGSKNTAPDMLSLYRYTREERTYRLLCVRAGESTVYTTLFPEHLLELGRAEDELLGGQAQVRDITVSAPEEQSLLVLADDTASAYLPFLATHYRRITVIDPRIASAEQLAGIDVNDYDRVLLACSVKTLLQEEVFSPLSAEK